MPTLRGARVSLRALRETDLPALHAVFSDAEVTRFWSAPPLADEAAAAALLGEIRAFFALAKFLARNPLNLRQCWPI